MALHDFHYKMAMMIHTRRSDSAALMMAGQRWIVGVVAGTRRSRSVCSVPELTIPSTMLRLQGYFSLGDPN